MSLLSNDSLLDSMKLPTELLDTIADNVTETADLLSLGLTCKYLAKSIFHHKLFYHTISESWYQPNLWHHLITNPEISSHIRRLHITRGAPNRKMRLQVDLCKNHPYIRPENVEPRIWINQLLARALCQMVNLKALVWLFEETPILDANSDIGKDYPNLRILKQLFFVLAPPRPLEKIIGFPTGVKVRDHLESFEYICQSTLRIISIAAESIDQLTNFAVHFPNVECIDMRRSGILRYINNKPNKMKSTLSGLSGFRRLRVVLGIQLWKYNKLGQIKINNKFLRWIHTLFPCFEFSGTEQGGIIFTRDDNAICNWHWVPPPPGWPSKFLGREQDFTIHEEYDRFAS
ncbi:hypothetical protein Clacol_004984 [Clathrus columnatus]|uniref:F-box domain-containing protein n=1 Tax=Clathrus columnatus TaxID=1419009 RepID=A0AAV5A802_9AGAM|nr:hypothetical protein Clacol_004984 [Clathrus columnatus]